MLYFPHTVSKLATIEFMDRFEAMRAFTHVVDQGGFAAAGRTLHMSRSTVNKHVMQLEDRLGVQLLTRTTRKVTPTDTGYAFYERCLAILGDLDSAELSASSLQREARGTLKISAPMSFGTMYLNQVVAEFMGLYPDLRIQLTLSDRISDPIEDGADVTVRVTQPPGPANLTAHRIADGRMVICAAPAYISREGQPAHPDDLKRHTCLHYGNLATGNVWRLKGPGGEHAVRVSGPLCSNNGEALREAALAGHGIVMQPSFIVEDYLKSGRLRRLLEDYDPPQLAVFVVYPPNRHLSAKIQLFTEFLIERFADAPDNR